MSIDANCPEGQRRERFFQRKIGVFLILEMEKNSQTP